MSFQIQGNAGVVAEVETNTRAMRHVIKADDYASLGIYSMGLVSGIIAAGLTANSPIASFRNSTVNPYIIRRIHISAGDTATAFAAGAATFNLFFARSFSASDTGGTSATLTGNNGKLRTSMATTGLANFQIANAGTMTAGTRTLDAQQLSSVSVAVSATAGSGMQFFNQSVPIWDNRIGEYPLVCAQNEGWVIQATVPATGTWTFSCWVSWEELAAYS